VAAETETGFMIDGRLYPVPDLGTFTMDEAQILYELAGLSLEDFAASEDEDDEASAERRRRLRNPGFMRALMHIAYQRGNPDMKPARVAALIGNANVVQAFEHLVPDEDEGDDASPPDVTSEPAPSSRTSSDDSSASSGGASSNGLGTPDESPVPTGITRSPTSPTLDPTTLDS
jgi:hypothetical protein